MIIRVETYPVWPDGVVDTTENAPPVTTRDIDYRRKADRVWLAKHTQWAFNNGRGVQTYRVR